MRVAIVNPIAVTPNLDTGSLLRARTPPPIQDPVALQQLNIVELGSAIASRGHHVSVLLTDVSLGNQSWRLNGGLRLVPVPTHLRSPFHPGLVPFTPNLRNHPELTEADVIQSSNFHQPATYFASVAAASARVPLVVWQELYRNMRFPGSLYDRLFEGVVGSTIRRVPCRFVPRTTRARAFLPSLGVSPGRISDWIPTGVDLDTFAPKKSRYTPEDFGWPPHARVLGVVSRLHRDKGVDLALLAVRRLLRRVPQARLVVRGSGPERGPLQQLAARLGLNEHVRFLGRLDRPDMVHLLNLFELLLAPSRNDLLPFALMEASGCGLPVVATDVGCVRDIVVDGVTGRLVPPNDPSSLADAVAELLLDEDLRTRLGKAARGRMETHFDRKGVARKLVEVYHEVGA